MPVASRYTHDVVSRTRCAHARTLSDPATSNPCNVFATLQGFAVSGTPRLLRGCAEVTTEVTNIDRLKGKDCVAVPVSTKKARGDLYVWLEHHDGRWRVAAAVSLVHHLR